MSSVYIMVEVELPDVKKLTKKIRENAKRDVDDMLMEGLIRRADNLKSDGAVYKHATILPDDMPAILGANP